MAKTFQTVVTELIPRSKADAMLVFYQLYIVMVRNEQTFVFV